MVKDYSHSKWLSEYANKLLEEQSRLDNLFRSSGVADEIQKTQSLASSFASEIQKMVQDNSHDKWSEYARNLLKEQNRWKDLLHSSGVADEIQKMQSLSSSFVAEIQRWQDQFRSFSIVAEIQIFNIDSASLVISRLSEMADNLRNVDYIINPDGTITGQENIFNQSSVQAIIESYLETAGEADNVGFEIKINNILNDIQKHHPVISKIIINILLPLFISIFTTIYFSPPIKIDYAHLAKQFKNEIRQIEIGNDFYNSFRFVSAKTLTVRSKNWTKSKCVGKLYFGNLVRVIQKKKNWALIEYRDKEGNIIVKGWVFTRYIKRLD